MRSLRFSVTSALAATLMAVLTAAMGAQALADAGNQSQNTSEALPAAQTKALDTNPFNIPDEHWVNMKKLAAKIQELEKPQPIMVKGKLNPKIVNNSAADLAFMDAYVRYMGVKKGSLGVHIGIIDGNNVSSLSIDKRLSEMAERVQDTVSRSYKNTGAYVVKIIKIAPSKEELAKLTEAELESGLLLYVRGQRVERLIVDGGKLGYIYIDPEKFYTDLQSIYDAGDHYKNNEEYNTAVEENIKAINSKIKKLNSDIERIEQLQKRLEELSTKSKKAS